jgi:hypothetical protein
VTPTAQLIRDTQRTVAGLAAEVRRLHERLEQDGAAIVRHALRRRGLMWKKVFHEGCLVPRAAGAREEFYQLLRHYSFRLFLRDVVKQRHGFQLADLTRYCSPGTARRYLRWLQAHRLVRRAGARFCLVPEVISFGPTLEWFVATVLQREYGFPCAWNVRLDAARGGGDYDVVGFAEGVCVYIETKSSPPRNIDAPQVHAFFERLETLRPQVALFLNDTQLRMGDKIVPLFTAELRRRWGTRRPAVQRLSGELFTAGAGLFIVNSDPDLVANIGTCLAQHFRRQTPHRNGHG